MQRLEEAMTKLRLSGAKQTLTVRLQEAVGNNLSHQEFLELLFQDELAVRKQRAIQRRIKKAEFRDLKSLDIVGIYPNYAEALAAWKAAAHRTVDNAMIRYFIVHMHRLLDPEHPTPADAKAPS